MQRPAAVAGSVIFFLVAPGTVAGLVPWWISRWRMEPPFLGFASVRLLGIILIAAGLPMLLDSFTRFALQGLGTPAPVAPPERLVVTGLYRYVRNPMYVGIMGVVMGQAVLLGDLRVLEYGVIVWLVFHLWVLAYEEPALRAKFGAEYERYCANVGRWIPRMGPWPG